MTDHIWWTTFDDAYGGIIQRAEGMPDDDDTYTYYPSDECERLTAHLSTPALDILNVLLLDGYRGKLDQLIEASSILAGGDAR